MTILDEHARTDRDDAAVRDADLRLFSRVAAGAALVAAAVHALVTPEHLTEAPVAGWFFLAVTGLQVGLAFTLLRRPLGTRGLLAALTGQMVVVVLYVASRTADLAFLPAHGRDHLPVAGGIGEGSPEYPGAHMEQVAALDMVCLGAELVVVAMLVALLPPRWRSRSTTVLALLAAAALVARGAGVLA